MNREKKVNLSMNKECRVHISMNKEHRVNYFIMNKEHRVNYFIMNKTGMSELMGNIAYLIVLVLFASSMLYFVSFQKHDSGAWTEAYQKEISRVINSAKPGDVIRLNVHRATEVAVDNNLKYLDDLFTFNNVNKSICIKLTSQKPSCYPFFNEVVVADYKLEQAVPGNILSFRIAKSTGGAA